MRLALTLACMLSIATSLKAGDGASDSVLYARSVDSVVCVRVDRKDGPYYGSGFLIDAERHLVLTAYHVVTDAAKGIVFFPLRDKQGDVIGDLEPYREGIDWLVLEKDPIHDLALLYLRSVPPSSRGISIALKSSKATQSVVTIGNDGYRGPFWRFSSGTVRQVYKGYLIYPSGQKVYSRVVDLAMTTQGGDSGSPVMNRRGELIGMIVGCESGHSIAIDVDAIWAFLGKRDMNVTLHDHALSVFGDKSAIFAYRVLFSATANPKYPLSYRYSVTVDAEGHASSSPIAVAHEGAPELPPLSDVLGLFTK